MRKFTLFIVLLGSCLISRAQVRQDINSFTSAQRTTLVNLMMDYITPEVIEKHCNYNPNEGPSDHYPFIHSAFSFLRFHHTYLEGMEDYLYLHGHPEFVPLPKWNPAGCAPIEFQTCGPLSNGVDADCGAATCHNGNGSCNSITNWCPTQPFPSYLLPPSQPGGNDGICQWQMLFTTYNDADNQQLNYLGNKIESPYHNGVHNGLNGMNGVMSNFRSPSAPVFWIWHGYVDDLWKYWQCNCPNSIYNIPVDLYMKDQKEIIYPERDWGEEPNIDQGPMWISSDIWVRNGTDGFTTDEHQNPQYDPNGSDAHVYVRVRNRGCDDYASGAQLYLYWAKASTNLPWPSPWDGSANQPGQPPMGEPFASMAIPAIVAGGQTIVEFPWSDVPNPLDYSNGSSLGNFEQHHFCLLARIVYANDPMTFPEGSILVDNARNNNNIVWKNISIVDENGSNGGFGAVVFVGDAQLEAQAFDLNFDNAEVFEQVHHLTDEAEVRILLDDNIWDKWVAGGSQGTNIKVDRETDGARTLLVTGPHAALNNLAFEPGEQNKIAVEVNFLTDKSSEQREFDYDITQVRADGKAIGGERMHVIKPERLQRLVADAGNDQEITDMESAQLSAASANEPAVYNWYDQNDSLIYSGTNFTVTPEITTRYKLQLTAQSDGFRDYDSVTVKVKDCYLKNIYPNPVSSSVTIEYKTKNVSSAYLIIIQPYGNSSNNYILNLNQTQKTLDLSTLPSGDYNVILVCDGQYVDVKSISKL